MIFFTKKAKLQKIRNPTALYQNQRLPDCLCATYGNHHLHLGSLRLLVSSNSSVCVIEIERGGCGARPRKTLKKTPHYFS